MLHAERQSLFEVTLQHFPAETRNAEDQVDRQIRKTRSLRPADSFDGLHPRMTPVHQPQLVIVERLHAHAQPVCTVRASASSHSPVISSGLASTVNSSTPLQSSSVAARSASPCNRAGSQSDGVPPPK